MLVLLVFALVAVAVCSVVSAQRTVVQLKGANFELAISSYKYVAILFYDKSESGRNVRKDWSNAALEVTEFDDDSEIAEIDSEDPDVQEIIDAYGIRVPSVKVFRKGILGEYHGSLKSSKEIAAFLQADFKPSVVQLSTLEDVNRAIKKQTATKAMVIGIFNADDMIDEDDVDSSYSVKPWSQYQAAADSMRGHAVFYAASSTEIALALHVEDADKPAIYKVADNGEKVLEYHGEILEINLSQWVLKNITPGVSELSVATTNDELYTTQFFSSNKLKFILLVRSEDVESPSSLEDWKQMPDVFKSQVIFSYMVDSGVADVLEFFSVNAAKDLPLIVAHDPSNDFKYKSAQLANLQDKRTLLTFVTGVVAGKIAKMVKSEPVPPAPAKGQHVIQAVGTTVLELVSQPDKDVLLELYAPWCAHCKKLRSTYDILGRAVAAESRIVVAKMDATANDVPTSWNVKGFPALLWFPAKDKPYTGTKGPVPRPYWDAGMNFYELVGFVQRESSFDMKSLKVATVEQQRQLLSEEDTIQQKYEEEDRKAKRNEDRVVYDNLIMDYLLGEVVFDGKRWHVVAAAALILFSFLAISSSSNGGGNRASVANKKK